MSVKYKVHLLQSPLNFVRSTKNFSNPIDCRAPVPAFPASLGLESNAILDIVQISGTISKMALKSAGTSVLRNRFLAVARISAWIPLKI